MSERGTWKVSTAYEWEFFVPDTDGITGKTGLVDANFTKKMLKDGAVDATADTVTEINAGTRQGWYKAAYTPAATGHFTHVVSHATYLPLGWKDELQVGAAGGLDDIPAAVLAAVVDGAITVKQALALIQAATVLNNTGEPNNPVTFFAPDGTTVRISSTIDANGNRTVTVTPP